MKLRLNGNAIQTFTWVLFLTLIIKTESGPVLNSSSFLATLWNRINTIDKGLNNKCLGKMNIYYTGCMVIYSCGEWTYIFFHRPTDKKRGDNSINQILSYHNKLFIITNHFLVTMKKPLPLLYLSFSLRLKGSKS